MRHCLNIGSLSLIINHYWGRKAKHTLFQVTCDAAEPGVTFGIGIWGIFALFISLEGGHIHRYMPAKTMLVGVNYFDGLLMLYGWTPRDDPGERRYLISLPDLFLGRSSHQSEIVGEYDAVIPMPEGNYPARISILRCTWSRPRWAHPRITQRAEIAVNIPVPLESGWALTQTLTAPAQTLPEAVGYVVESALLQRERYGGTIAWLPSGANFR